MTTLEISNIQTTFSEIRSKLDAHPGFTNFVLNNVVIDGEEDNMIDVAKHFRGHTVESATFRNVVATHADVDLGLIISTILVTSYHLRQLHVKRMRFCANSIIASVPYALRLESIALIQCNLTDEHAMKLVDALAKNAMVACVDVEGNNFSDLGSHAFTDGLKKKSHVTNVKMDKMSSGDTNSMGVEKSAQKKSATAA